MADICVISDGKAGHRNQSLGLAEALQRQRPALEIGERLAERRGGALLQAIAPSRRAASAPTLVIGAGHGTHAELLYWRRRGSRAVVLMRPSLPLRCFDLCIEPRHDGGSEGARRWLSTGPLNRVVPAAERRDLGLVLIGGPSPHFQWDGEALLAQLAALCSDSRPRVLTTSRRTPPAFLAALRAQALPGLEALAAEELDVDWLARTLPAASTCWVTPDSASMVYEALTAGCAVGLFDLAAIPDSRVARGVQELVEQDLCTPFTAIAAGAELPVPRSPLAEADRMATRLLELGWL